MQPLDLRVRAPRSPREKLGGLVMLARTIDKLRATLPGGDLGPYHVFYGLSKYLADALHINLHELADVVRNAAKDEDVVAWVHAHSDPAKYEAINRGFERATQTEHIGPEARANFESKYTPELRALHDNLFDLVEADDRALYPAQ
jgi:hypothetical protein